MPVSVKDVLRLNWQPIFDRAGSPASCFLVVATPRAISAEAIASVLRRNGIDAIEQEEGVLVPVYDAHGSPDNYRVFMDLVRHSGVGSMGQYTHIREVFKDYQEYLETPKAQKRLAHYFAVTAAQDDAPAEAHPARPRTLEPIGGGMFRDDKSKTYLIPESVHGPFTSEFEELRDKWRKADISSKLREVDGIPGQTLLVSFANGKFGKKALIDGDLNEFKGRHTSR